MSRAIYQLTYARSIALFLLFSFEVMDPRRLMEFIYVCQSVGEEDTTDNMTKKTSGQQILNGIDSSYIYTRIGTALLPILSGKIEIVDTGVRRSVLSASCVS